MKFECPPVHRLFVVSPKLYEKINDTLYKIQSILNGFLGKYFKYIAQIIWNKTSFLNLKRI